MAEVVPTLQILGDVSKSAEVIWVLGGAGDIPDLMLCYDALTEKVGKWEWVEDTAANGHVQVLDQ